MGPCQPIAVVLGAVHVVECLALNVALIVLADILLGIAALGRFDTNLEFLSV